MRWKSARGAQAAPAPRGCPIRGCLIVAESTLEAMHPSTAELATRLATVRRRQQRAAAETLGSPRAAENAACGVMW